MFFLPNECEQIKLQDIGWRNSFKKFFSLLRNDCDGLLSNIPPREGLGLFSAACSSLFGVEFGSFLEQWLVIQCRELQCSLFCQHIRLDQTWTHSFWELICKIFVLLSVCEITLTEMIFFLFFCLLTYALSTFDTFKHFMPRLCPVFLGLPLHNNDLFHGQIVIDVTCDGWQVFNIVIRIIISTKDPHRFILKRNETLVKEVLY